MNKDERVRLEDLEAQLSAGTTELRRYVEGNGFEWCEQESTVFNVTTAIGWLSGALQEAQRKLAEMQARTCATCKLQLKGLNHTYCHRSVKDGNFCGDPEYGCVCWQPRSNVPDEPASKTPVDTQP